MLSQASKGRGWMSKMGVLPDLVHAPSTHAHPQRHAGTPIHLYTQVQAHAYMDGHSTHLYAPISTNTQMHTCTSIHTSMHTHTCTFACIHVHIHPHTHAHMCTIFRPTPTYTDGCTNMPHLCSKKHRTTMHGTPQIGILLLLLRFKELFLLL